MHKNCHKNKTFEQAEQELLKKYRKIRKSFVPKDIKLNSLEQDKLQKLHIQIMLKLEKNNNFKY